MPKTTKKEVENPDGLEVVDKSQGEKDDTAPKIVLKDNGTQSFENSKMEKVTADGQVEGAASMDNTSDFVGEKVDYIETPVVVREKRIINESLTASKYQELLENYKKNNPKKYKAKKAELEAKLAQRIASDKEAAKN